MPRQLSRESDLLNHKNPSAVAFGMLSTVFPERHSTIERYSSIGKRLLASHRCTSTEVGYYLSTPPKTNVLVLFSTISERSNEEEKCSRGRMVGVGSNPRKKDTTLVTLFLEDKELIMVGPILMLRV